MPNRLIGIVVCLLLANVVNYALGEWVDAFTAPRAPTSAQHPGGYLSSNLDRSVGLDTPASYDSSGDPDLLADYFRYLDGGGDERLLRVMADANWQRRSPRQDAVPVPYFFGLGSLAAPDEMTSRDQPELISELAFYDRAVQQAAHFNTERFLAIFLLAAVLICLFAGFLHETGKLTPLLYFVFTVGTAAIYGHLTSYLFTAVVAGAWLLYYGGLRLALPIYHAEWSRLIRPSLTPVILLLATMAFRGPDLPDLWFWTSPLFRLALTFTLLLAAYFHFHMLFRVLRSAQLKRVARWFAIGIPLGITLLVMGLFLGLYAPGIGTPLSLINYELVLLPNELAAGWSRDAPLVVALGGFLVLIASGIGYFIQRIAH